MEALFFGRVYQNSKSIVEQEQEFVKLKTNKGVKVFEKLRLLDLKISSFKVVEYYVQLCSKELTWLCFDDTRIKFQSLEKLGSFTELWILEMNHCVKLVKLPPFIGNLFLLTELQLSWCKALKTLPDTIGKLEKLQILQLGSCHSLEGLPTSIGGLISLKKFNCEYCKSLAKVFTNVGQLRKLEALSFEGCSQLKTLLTSICGLTSFKRLNCTICKSLAEVPTQVGQLRKLEALSFKC